MKVQCIKNRTSPSSGVFGIGAHDGKPISGLTLYRVYEVQVVNLLSYGGNTSVSNDIQFLLFNDNKEWQTVDVSYFQPFEG